MKTVAVYIRVSNHSYAEASMQKQEQIVREYCDQNGYTVGEARCVIGDPKTAYPMLLALLNSTKEKGIDTVVMPSTKFKIYRCLILTVTPWVIRLAELFPMRTSSRTVFLWDSHSSSQVF